MLENVTPVIDTRALYANLCRKQEFKKKKKQTDSPPAGLCAINCNSNKEDFFCSQNCPGRSPYWI